MKNSHPVNFKHDKVNAHKGIFDQKGISYFILDILFRYDSFRRKHHIQRLPGYSGNYIGRSWIDRITFRNSLDPINGVWWSDENMDDLFSWR